MFNKSLFSILFILGAYCFAFSQTNPSKFVFVREGKFSNTKTGITELINANKKVSECLSDLRDEIKQNNHELKNSNLSPEERKKKLKKIKSLFKEQQERYNKSCRLLTEIVHNKIKHSIEDLESITGLNIIRIWRDKDVFYFDKTLDFTEEVIDYFNDATKPTERFFRPIPSGKIAILDSDILFTDETRIKILFGKTQFELKDEKIGKLISKELKAFGIGKGYNIIYFDDEIIFFSSEKKNKFKNSNSEDITEQFIKYFNNKYPTMKEN